MAKRAWLLPARAGAGPDEDNVGSGGL